MAINEIIRVINQKFNIDICKIIKEMSIITMVNGHEIDIEDIDKIRINQDIKLLITPLMAEV